MPVTVPQTELNLLSYFQTGDVPTQDQFEEFIRTMFYLNAQAQAAADAATAAVADLAALTDKIPFAFGRVILNSGGATINAGSSRFVGCTAAVLAADGLKTDVTITFAPDAAPDTKYAVLLDIDTIVTTDAYPKVVSRSTGSFVLRISNQGSGLNASFAVMP